MSDSNPKPRAANAGPSSGPSHPEPVERLIDELAKLPGIGRRSAERMAFHLLKATAEDALQVCLDEVCAFTQWPVGLSISWPTAWNTRTKRTAASGAESLLRAA